MINKKAIVATIIITLVSIVVILVYSIITLSNRSGKQLVSLLTVPSDTKLSIDGKSIQNGDIYLKPAIYIIKAEKEGFTSKSITITVDKSTDKNHTFGILLTPISDEAKQWSKNHQSDYRKVEAIAGQTARENGELFIKQNPIVEKLPYHNFLYSIGYRKDPNNKSDNSIIIEITALDVYRDSAIQEIRNMGFNPEDYIINFNNYHNPFEGTHE